MTFDQEALLRGFAGAVEAHHAELTALDQRSGDGDFGDNLRGGLRTAISRFGSGRGEAPFDVLGAVFLDEVGGTSGPLLGLLFSEIGRAMEGGEDPVSSFASGTRAGLEAIQRVGEAQVGDRTMVDALAPAVDAMPHGFAAAARAATDGALRTAQLQARMGRASYVGDRAVGWPDPGAVGIALLFHAAAAVAEPGAEVPALF